MLRTRKTRADRILPVEAGAVVRLRVQVGGAVQGVGFRPFVHRLAKELDLAGWVANDGQGVILEMEGSVEALRGLLPRLTAEAPSGSRVEGCEATWLDPVGARGFHIRESESDGRPGAWVRPDTATCEDCLREVRNPADRRYRYPFANCTHCGPRYTIIERLPYDRANTSMRHFTMCLECQAEYLDPTNRRFHAQPNACPNCGPRLILWDAQGEELAGGDAALCRAVDAVRAGLIVAVKGLGGFHLMVRADDAEAVRRLRERKRREEKPFAIMAPDFGWVRAECEVSTEEERLLRAPEAPIVLLQRRLEDAHRAESRAGANVAPGQSTLGVMLPYTPLHHLLMGDLGLGVVATSGNLGDEPICIDECEALVRLRGVADLFLVHDRPIVRHVDDSIVRVVMDRELVLRRARGFAPLPVRMTRVSSAEGEVILGVGAHLKNSVALAIDSHIFISQHIGDLETVEAYDAFRRVVSDLQGLYEVSPAALAADGHPDYLSTRYARESGTRVETVQHHLAHIAAVMVENELRGPALGVCWDGTGLGSDGTIWGGEFLRVEGASWERVAHLRQFPLPGGDLVAREPRRSALGLLMEWKGNQLTDADGGAVLKSFTSLELDLLAGIIRSGVNTPRTSSVGRLFDAVTSWLGVRHRCRYEGQAAMELEALAGQAEEGYGCGYHLVLRPGGSATERTAQLDWAPLLEEVQADLRERVAPATMAARFHDALIEAVVDVARHVGETSVALGGGCFQNRLLLEGCVRRLREEGCRVYWPQRVPPNDGGLAVGQVAVARWRRGGGMESSETLLNHGSHQAINC